jgi:hypothetical protein
VPLPVFLLCVEPGRLEAQTVLCVESLRKWGGELAGAPIYAFAPREGHDPAAETVGALERLGTAMVTEPLNDGHSDLPIVNKVYVSEWAERNLDAETLVFVDSDSVFLNEPREFLQGDWVAAVRPVGVVNMGSTGAGHRNEEFWGALYAELEVEERPFVETIVKRKRIRAYFNAGLVATRRDAGLMGRWRAATERLLDSIAREEPLRSSVDQLALAGTLARDFGHVRVLPETYNFPLQKRVRLPADLQALDLPDLVHVHPHRWLHLPGFLGRIHPPLDPSTAQYRWLDERLPLEPILDEPFPFSDG